MEIVIIINLIANFLFVVVFFFGKKHFKALQRLLVEKDIQIDNLEREQKYLRLHVENITRRIRLAMLGTKVICRSNDDEPIMIGTIVEFQEITQAKNPVPIVQEDTGRLYTVLGAVVPYSEQKMNEIKNMTYKEQWEHMKGMGLYWE